MNLSQLAAALVVTAEVIGHELSPAAAKSMARRLVAEDHAAVGTALDRCMRDLSGRLTLAAVLQRLPNGFPGAEEAWAQCPRDEAQTVIWSEQSAHAYGMAAPLLAEGDAVAARMAFRETYRRLVQEAIERGDKACWTVSLGTSVLGRHDALRGAVERGQLTQARAESCGLLPPATSPAPQLVSGVGKKLKLGH